LDEINFDGLCELAARTGRARGALITRLHRDGGPSEVLGRYGTVKTFEPEFELPLLDPVTKPMIAIQDIAKEPAFAGHPITKTVPTIHALIAAILSSEGTSGRTSLKLLNPDVSIFDDLEAFASLSKLIGVYQMLFHYMDMAGADPIHSLHPLIKEGGFQEAVAADVGPAAKFLLDTLFHRLSLRSRSAATFVSLRTWRKSIKAHQIAVLLPSNRILPTDFCLLSLMKSWPRPSTFMATARSRPWYPFPAEAPGWEIAFQSY
jgi:hypothetical protein